METSDQKTLKEWSKLLNAISTDEIIMPYFGLWSHHIPLEKWGSQIIQLSLPGAIVHKIMYENKDFRFSTSPH